MALGNYQGLDGYLATTHRNTAHPTVLPGALDSAREGYGVYVGNEISGQAALDRSARDAANSRLALMDTMDEVASIRNFQDQEALRASNLEVARLANEQSIRDAELARMQFEIDRPALALKMQESDRTARIRKQEMDELDALSKGPLFTIFSELYNNGRVSPQTIAEYNASVADNPAHPQLSDFVKDPATGELYGISDKGEYVPFASTGVLDAWMTYHPRAREWALTAYPEPVRNAKKEEMRILDDQAKSLRDQQKHEQDLAKKDRDLELNTLNKLIDHIDEDISFIQDQLQDGAYSSEEERVALEAQLKQARAQRRLYADRARAVYDPGLILQAPTGGTTAEAAARFQAAQQSAQGVSFGGGGGPKSWRDVGKGKPQQ